MATTIIYDRGLGHAVDTKNLHDNLRPRELWYFSIRSSCQIRRTNSRDSETHFCQVPIQFHSTGVPKKLPMESPSKERTTSRTCEEDPSA